MKAFLNRLLAAAYFYLCFAPVPMMLGVWLIDDFKPALIAAGVLMPLSLLIVLLPDWVGGRKRRPEPETPTARGNGDPDPDRNLRSDAMPVRQRGGGLRFPVRMFALIVSSLAVTLSVCFAPILGLEGIFIFYRAMLGASLGVMLLLAEYCIATGEACNRRAILTGIVVYITVGFLSSHAVESRLLQACLYYMGLAFLFITGFLLNERTLSAGAIQSQAFKAPRSIRRRNRVILTVFAALTLIISRFDAIRHAVSEAFKWSMRSVIDLIGMFNDLLLRLFNIEMTTTVQQEAQEIMEIGEGAAESSGWSAIEIAGIAAAALILLGIVGILGVKLARWLKKFLVRVKEWSKRFASGVGEEYEDVRESLLDFRDARVSFSQNLRDRMAKAFKRDPRWADLDARGKIRFLMASIYRKNRGIVPNYAPLTAHEAMAEMRSGFPRPDAFADLYDLARYSQHEVTEQQAERARQEGRL